MNNVMEWVSMFFVLSGIISAIIIMCDLPQHKQGMRIMNVVWVLTGLWSSYLGLWAYFSFGRGKAVPKPVGSGVDPHDHDDAIKEMQGMQMNKDGYMTYPKEDSADTKSNGMKPSMDGMDMGGMQMDMPKTEDAATANKDGNSAMPNMENKQSSSAKPMNMGGDNSMKPSMNGMDMGGMQMDMPKTEDAATANKDGNSAMANMGVEQNSSAKPMNMGGNNSMKQSMDDKDMESMQMEMPQTENATTTVKVENRPMDGMDKMHSNSTESMNMDGDKSMKQPMKEKDMSGMQMDGMKMDGMSMNMNRPKWQSVALSALHCGAGCTLADLLGEWFTSVVPMHIGGSMIAGQWVFDFCLALVIGVFFQFIAIREMQKISAGKAIGKAIKADFFSLTSWQVGMYVWMSIVFFAMIKGLEYHKDTWTYWFMMQVAMLVGFFFAYPTNALLIKLGIKKGM